MEVRELAALLARFDEDAEVVLLTDSGSVRTVDDAYVITIHADKREILPEGSRLSSEDRVAAQKVVAIETE